MVSRKGDGRMRNVILIGMPGCGKSTVGVLAAKALTMDFVDTDLLLQRKAGRPLQRMVDELGAEGFAHVEEACVCGLEARGTVIATGGSVAMEDAAMEHLKEGGLVIFLRLPLETLSRRLKNMKTRGIAMEKGQTLRDLYARRQPAPLEWADAAGGAGRHGGVGAVGDVRRHAEVVARAGGDQGDAHLFGRGEPVQYLVEGAVAADDDEFFLTGGETGGNVAGVPAVHRLMYFVLPARLFQPRAHFVQHGAAAAALRRGIVDDMMLHALLLRDVTHSVYNIFQQIAIYFYFCYTVFEKIL